LNFLYERYIYKGTNLKSSSLKDPLAQSKLDVEEMFSYKDPRLRHLKEGFRKEELHVKLIDFGTGDDSDFKRAMDEIV
jgi:hypothetical protein